MDSSIKQIADRLKGLREVLDLSSQEVADAIDMSLEDYQAVEKGEKEISISSLQKISRKWGISLDVLLFGQEPKMSKYFLTRSGCGESIERTKAYKYQSLASGFRGRSMEFFEVSVEPGIEKTLNSHEGEEFCMVMEGRMELTVGKKVFVLEKGDSLYFDSSLSHGMMALDGKPSKCLSVII